jgi:hypothetical protein
MERRALTIVNALKQTDSFVDNCERPKQTKQKPKRKRVITSSCRAADDIALRQTKQGESNQSK